ncbi:hypothetical protein [Micromonospora sp. NPDC005220]|uniref:hypothetical protein n=1 Tax=Micromonospora sp. NPDC005220 TaxID=3155589 RepID=UPI0033A1E570
MSLPLPTPTTHDRHQHTSTGTDNTPPTRSKISGVLAVVACAACCALPFLIAAGVLTTAGAAILEKTLYAVAAGLVVLALGMWWLHRRRTVAEATCGCGGAGCGC